MKFAPARSRRRLAVFTAWVLAVSGIAANGAPTDKRGPAADRPAVASQPEAPVANSPALLTLTPLPYLEADARRTGLPIGAFAPPDAGAARVGDTVLLLVDLGRKDRHTQWLIRLRIAEPTAAERAEKPPPDFYMSLNANGGAQLRFANAHRLALDIRTAGPVTAETKPADAIEIKQARTLMSPDLLGLGLDESARVMLRYKAMGPEAAAKFTPAHLPPEELRAAMGFAPALLALFQAVQATPGLREVLWETAEKPSLWSIVKHGGRVDMNLNVGNEGLDPLDTAPWRAATSSDVFRMPLVISLNDTPALRGALSVAAPQPPLLASAGIVGIEADPPKGTAKHLVVRVVASQRGPEPVADRER